MASLTRLDAWEIGEMGIKYNLLAIAMIRVWRKRKMSVENLQCRGGEIKKKDEKKRREKEKRMRNVRRETRGDQEGGFSTSKREPEPTPGISKFLKLRRGLVGIR